MIKILSVIQWSFQSVHENIQIVGLQCHSGIPRHSGIHVTMASVAVPNPVQKNNNNLKLNRLKL